MAAIPRQWRVHVTATGKRTGGSASSRADAGRRVPIGTYMVNATTARGARSLALRMARMGMSGYTDFRATPKLANR